MKKSLALILASTMVLSLTACAAKEAAPPASSAAKPTEAAKKETQTSSKASDSVQEKPDLILRLSEDQSIEYPTTMGCLRFADLVYERTNGRIKVEVYDSGTLGNTTAVIEQLQYGAIDLCRCGVGDLSQFSPRLSLFTLPFLFTSTENYYMASSDHVRTVRHDFHALHY